jgi:hypothetical protein
MAENTVTPVAAPAATTTPAAAAPVATPAAASRTFKVKVDGQEREVDEATLIRDYQISAAGMKRLQEASAKEKSIESFKEAFERDPVGTMQHFGKGKNGPEFRKAVEKFLLGELERDGESPEQKELRSAREDAAAARKELEKHTQDRSKKLAEEAMKREASTMDQEIAGAISTVGLPKTPDTVKRLAQIMLQNHVGKVGLSTAQCAQVLRREVEEAHRALLDGMDDEGTFNFLGDKVTSRLRKVEVARMKTPSPARAASTKPRAPKSDESPKYHGFKSLDARLEAIKKGKA